MTFLLLLCSSLLSCLGQLCQKQAAHSAPHQRHQLVLWLAIAMFCLAGAMVLWLQILRSLPVGIAYPMLSMNFVWITLAAHGLWKEPITARHWYGTGLIILGILFVSGAL